LGVTTNIFYADHEKIARKSYIQTPVLKALGRNPFDPFIPTVYQPSFSFTIIPNSLFH
jgi:hypothetical protein